MSTTNEKLEFIFAMARHSNVNLHDCKRIMRYAATLQRLAVEACNRQLTPSEFNKQRTLQLKISATCGINSGVVGVITSGDPRGCVVKLKMSDGYTNDWGQEGICVPA